MILAYCVIIGLVISYLAGGRLRYITEHSLRGLFLPILAFAIEAFAPVLARWIALPVHSWHFISVSVEYFLLFLFCGLNIRKKPLWVITAGVAMNFAVIAANGFRMPVTPVVYDYPSLLPTVERIASGELFEYVLTGYDAPLWFLGDTIPVPFLGIGLASLGDFFLAAGVGWLIFMLMREPKEKESPGETEGAVAQNTEG